MNYVLKEITSCCFLHPATLFGWLSTTEMNAIKSSETSVHRRSVQSPSQIMEEFIVVKFVTEGQSAALWGPWPGLTHSLVWHVLASWCGAPSLTRGRVCVLQCTSLTGQSRDRTITIYYCLIGNWVPFPSPHNYPQDPTDNGKIHKNWCDNLRTYLNILGE
jgi:hypothetical protein